MVLGNKTKASIKIPEKKFEELTIKASLFDELLEFIEDRYFGYLMRQTEKEKNISLKEAKKLLR